MWISDNWTQRGHVPADQSSVRSRVWLRSSTLCLTVSEHTAVKFKGFSLVGFASAPRFQTNALCKPSSSSSTDVEGRILFWSPAEAASGGSFLFTWTKDTISISENLEAAEINFLSKLPLLYFAMVTAETRGHFPALDLFICLQTEFHSEWNSTPSICMKTPWVPAWCMSSPGTLRMTEKTLDKSTCLRL